MFHFLNRAGVRLLDFKNFVLATSERLKHAALAVAERPAGALPGVEQLPRCEPPATPTSNGSSARPPELFCSALFCALTPYPLPLAPQSLPILRATRRISEVVDQRRRRRAAGRPSPKRPSARPPVSRW
jgi:hypothetical protein